MWASAVVAHRPSSWDLQALEHGLSSCAAQGLGVPPHVESFGPGVEPVSSALAGEFLSS